MKIRTLAAACGALLVSCGGSPSEPADLLLSDGVVHTLDAESTQAEAVAVRGDTIVCVGSERECQAHAGPATRRIDLAGKTLVPGLTDSHAHLAGIGFRELRLNLEGVASLKELVERVRERAAETPEGQWIVGRGWIESRWDPPVFPTASDLDRAAPDHPVYLVRVDGHGGVANTAALEAAGIDRSTPDPPGGEIVRDASGEATGMLLDRAQDLVRRLLPEQSTEGLREALRIGARRSVEMGWTELGVAGMGEDELAIVDHMATAGDLPLRLYVAVRGPGELAERLIEEGARGRRPDSPLLTVRGIKLVLDGALGSRGAAMFQPYEDADTRGLLMHEEADLADLLDGALRAGIQVQSHAIGDRANRLALDLYERAVERVRPAERAVEDPRWRIEHAQIIAPDDIPRFAELGVIASMQPSHAITDLHFAKRRIGEERLAGAYAWRSLLDAGARLAFGSDAPVERGDPMIELYAAVARRDLQGFSEDYWGAEQRLTREEALRGLTSWAAYATFEEDVRGTIEVGKLADLTALSGDPLAVPEDELPGIRAVLTVVDGEVVFEADE